MPEVRKPVDGADGGQTGYGVLPNNVQTHVAKGCPFCSSEVTVGFGGGNWSCLKCYRDFKVDVVTIKK